MEVGLFGKKLGMTQIFDDQGSIIPVLKFDTNDNNPPNLNSNKIIFSSIGYKSNWVSCKFVRSAEIWGSGESIQLALNNYSNFYNYFFLGSDYGKVRVRYIHGLLESVQDSLNRYVVGKGIEWTNKKSLVFGISETVYFEVSFCFKGLVRFFILSNKTI